VFVEQTIPRIDAVRCSQVTYSGIDEANGQELRNTRRFV
jgi:hypothetical protein